MGEGIIKYIENMDETLTPFQGNFIIHGAKPLVLEGTFTSDFIVIEFPSKQSAMDWYQSEAYQNILNYRKDNSQGDIFIIDGVGENHNATDILK